MTSRRVVPCTRAAAQPWDGPRGGVARVEGTSTSSRYHERIRGLLRREGRLLRGDRPPGLIFIPKGQLAGPFRRRTVALRFARRPSQRAIATIYDGPGATIAQPTASPRNGRVVLPAHKVLLLVCTGRGQHGRLVRYWSGPRTQVRPCQTIPPTGLQASGSTASAPKPRRASVAIHAACTSWPSSSASSTGVTSRSGCSSARGSTAAAAPSGRSGPMRCVPSTRPAAETWRHCRPG